MTIRTVLDESALLKYANLDDAAAVGEYLMLVNEENSAIGEDPDDVEAYSVITQVGVPTSAFVAAYGQTDSLGRNLLAEFVVDLALAEQLGDPERSALVLLPLSSAHDLLEAGDLETRFPGQGEAMLHAMRHNAALATFNPPKKPVPGVTIADLSMSWDD
ncbi:MAG: hypothetical protein HOU81_19340 [Hamadaea sp.]|uniref:hypothetical protein n=1 Tax=Hamadaea sp. TaxID=2024425 RepID=UPI0017A6FA28|nr:hypothetical protein [Hamadaea sp.]NUR72976.1 hypothetical protein [Hamadaea sp.]NUT21237.1 hypothetical protein [Hamadaea sp.]